MYCGNNEEFPYVPLDYDDIGNRAYISYGITTYNNIADSLLTVFMIINGDTWYN